jgi:hypothetical protein
MTSLRFYHLVLAFVMLSPAAIGREVAGQRRAQVLKAFRNLHGCYWIKEHLAGSWFDNVDPDRPLPERCKGMAPHHCVDEKSSAHASFIWPLQSTKSLLDPATKKPLLLLGMMIYAGNHGMGMPYSIIVDPVSYGVKDGEIRGGFAGKVLSKYKETIPVDPEDEGDQEPRRVIRESVREVRDHFRAKRLPNGDLELFIASEQEPGGYPASQHLLLERAEEWECAHYPKSLGDEEEP